MKSLEFFSERTFKKRIIEREGEQLHQRDDETKISDYSVRKKRFPEIGCKNILYIVEKDYIMRKYWRSEEGGWNKGENGN